MVVDAKTPRDSGDASAAVEHAGADAGDDLVDRESRTGLQNQRQRQDDRGLGIFESASAQAEQLAQVVGQRGVD